jgi:uncharacterized protein YndB with AHSA1/START domain
VTVAEAFETEIEIAAPPEVVFHHLVDEAGMLAWMGEHARLEPQPEGCFEVDVTGIPVRGRYLVVDRPRRVVVTWGVAGNDAFGPGTSTVEFLLTPTDGGTNLRLVHSDLPEPEVDPHRMGWAHFLPRLATAAAGDDPGPDVWT